MCPSRGLRLPVGSYWMVPEALPSTELPSSPLKREPGAFPTFLPGLQFIGPLRAHHSFLWLSKHGVPAPGDTRTWQVALSEQRGEPLALGA